MTLQIVGHALSLVVACSCKSRGGITLQKSALWWRHESASLQTGISIAACAGQEAPVTPPSTIDAEPPVGAQRGVGLGSPSTKQRKQRNDRN
jgi:hypothetical protein